MPSLDDRYIVTKHICATCKHCMHIRIIDDPEWIDYCFMDLSKEDKDHMYDQVNEVSDGYIDRFSDYSDRFKKIMMAGDEGFDVYDNARVMDVDNCCQFYESDF